MPTPQSNRTFHLTAAAHPVLTRTVDLELPEGLTLLEMLRAAQPDPALLRLDGGPTHWRQGAIIFIGDHEINPEFWGVIRPKAGALVTARVFPVLMGGGGGGGGKSPLRTILTIGVIAASFFLGPALGVALGFSAVPATAGLFAGINMAAAVGGAIISVAGQLLVNAIAPVKAPKLPQLSGAAAQAAESPSLFLAGSRNAARPYQPVPYVLGYYRFRPPLAAKTYTEVLGDHNILRMMGTFGYGEVEISDWRLGSTPLENFSDYTLEVRNGTDADDPHTIMPAQSDQEDFSIKLTQEAGWQVLQSVLDADQLSINLAFPRGLVFFNSGGTRSNRTVTVEVEWRAVGAGTWEILPDDFTATFDRTWVDVFDETPTSAITFTHARAVAIRHGIRWNTGARGQYEIRVRRTSADTDNTQIFDEVFWVTIRSFTNEDPVDFPHPLATFQLEMRATDQLNGVVDTLSALVKSVCLDWDRDTQTWIKRATNNPASLFRLVTMGPGKARPMTSANVDIEALQDWHEFCKDNGFTFNMVRDFSSSVFDTLADIASAGRAGLTNEDGKLSIVIDRPTDTIVTHITPRNSRAFEGEKAFLELPHAFRVEFPNEDRDYNQDERTVYLEGYDSSTATVFESLDFPGITDPEQIFKHTQYIGSTLVQRPEQWAVVQDYESLIARRGRRVKITHDMLLIGQASGRISAVTLDTGNITAMSVDEELTMEAGNSYGLVIRRNVLGDASITVPIVLEIGSGITEVTLLTPLSQETSGVYAGDLFGFGILGQATEDALVLMNLPQSDLAGKVVLIPYRPVIYEAGTGVIPPHVPTITEEAFIETVVIEQIVTDESVLERGPGDSLLVRAEVRARPIDNSAAFLQVQQRMSGTGEPYYYSQVTSRGPSIARLGDLQQGETYDFRVRWAEAETGRLPGGWAEVPGVLIVGKSTPPEALSSLTVAAFNGQALMQWSEASELDVRFGGVVHFRHSSSFDDPPWAESTSIGDVAQARSLQVSLPLKPGTYLARVFDADGNPGGITSVSTKQASTLTYANVASINEADAGFLGVHDGTAAIETGLILDTDGVFDSISDFDEVPNLDYLGTVNQEGTYHFNAGFDFGSVSKMRLTSRIEAVSVAIYDNLDDRVGSIDTWEDFDGTLQASADLRVWVRLTDSDPSSLADDAEEWGEWRRLDSMEVECRGVDARADLVTSDTAYNILCTVLSIDAEELA